ncbi:hypothetical protein XENORESO_016428, partial [Xenotaenia resolanae]
KLSVDSRVQEDLIIKKEMLELMEESHRCSSNTMRSINTSIEKITSTFQERFSVMRELLMQPYLAHSSSSSTGEYRQVTGHTCMPTSQYNTHCYNKPLWKTYIHTNM